MTLLWLATLASLLTALIAWNQARRTARRLAQLSERYWELKYQYSELRSQVQRPANQAEPEESRPSPRPAAEVFVPIASLKR